MGILDRVGLSWVSTVYIWFVSLIIHSFSILTVEFKFAENALQKSDLDPRRTRLIEI